MIFADYTLDRSTPIPLYYQLKGFILQEIQNGTYPVGTTIPTENEIKNRFQISRTTIRQAINELVQEGLLERQSSRGTFVTNPEAKLKPGHIKTFEPFYRQVNKTGKTARTELLDLKIKHASEEHAKWLGLAPGEKIIFISRRRFADADPMVTIQNFLPYSLCSFILSHDFEQESLHEILSQKQETTPYTVKNIISAARATAKDVELLQISIDSPVLSLHTISKAQDGTVIEHAFSHYQSELNKYEVELQQHQF